VIKDRPKPDNDHTVLIYPAMTAAMGDKKIYFLLSLYQVEDIQGKLPVYTVPFAVSFVEGMTVWRHLVIPLISLEHYLGLPRYDACRGQRTIILRVTQPSHEGVVDIRVALQTDREMKMIPIPDSGKRVESSGGFNFQRVKGIFEWDENIIVVPEMDKVFHAESSEMA